VPVSWTRDEDLTGGTPEFVPKPDPEPPGDPTPRISRGVSALQACLLCGIPTQLLVFGGLVLAHVPMTTGGSPVTLDASQISLQFFALSALLDTALVAILIRVFLRFSGETSRAVFLGDRSIATEFVRGAALLPILWVVVIALVFVLNVAFPSLHNVPENPYGIYMDTPLRSGVFIVVVIIAGGVREELQRAFILHRFERLGGAYAGLAIFGVAFGLMHLPQGIDVAIAVGVLGVIWGLIYIRRRSVIAPMVSHASFDVVQVLQQVLLHSLAR
jgi:membrane protease YdiL (CAAX protease family)